MGVPVFSAGLGVVVAGVREPLGRMSRKSCLWVSRSSLTTADYLHILDWTGRQLASGKRGRIKRNAPAILDVIDHGATRWAARVGAFGSGWHRAAGSAQDLIAIAERLGQRWMKGLRLALTLG